MTFVLEHLDGFLTLTEPQAHTHAAMVGGSKNAPLYLSPWPEEVCWPHDEVEGREVSQESACHPRHGRPPPRAVVDAHESVASVRPLASRIFADTTAHALAASTDRGSANPAISGISRFCFFARRPFAWPSWCCAPACLPLQPRVGQQGAKESSRCASLVMMRWSCQFLRIPPCLVKPCRATWTAEMSLELMAGVVRSGQPLLDMTGWSFRAPP